MARSRNRGNMARHSRKPIAGTIGLLKELPVVISVIGAADAFQQQVALQTGGVFVALPNAYTQNQQFR